jgi:DNA-binding beta-propeller fold protein YncE
MGTSIIVFLPPSQWHKEVAMHTRSLNAVALSIVVVVGMPPAEAGAQAPTYITQWGTSAGAGDYYTGTAGIAVDAVGNVYVTDGWFDYSNVIYHHGRVQKFSSDGALIMQWSTNDHEIDPEQGSAPGGVAVDAEGRVYVADMYGGSIRVYASTGSYLTQWNLRLAAPSAAPRGVAVDAIGDVYVADSSASYATGVFKYAQDGTLLTRWSTVGVGDGNFNIVHRLAVSASGEVFVTEGYANRVQSFTSSGGYVLQWGATGSANGQLLAPEGVAVDAGGLVYVVDAANDRIEVFTSTGVYVTQWGTTGSANGQFFYPMDVALDRMGNIYVADRFNHRVQKFGHLPTPATRASWGQLKTKYR